MNSALTDHKIMEPYAYILELPGKNVRGKLIEAFQLWLKAPPEAEETIQTIVDELHNASLLIDDIEDDSELRRGKPVAHLIYGVPATINCANYVYFISLQRCHSLQNQKAMQVYINEMLNLHRGQGLDIYWRDHTQCPSEEEYLEMVNHKTGGLFRLAVGLLQSFSECQLNFDALLKKIALYFQIRDDYINLIDIEYMEHKSFCEDLTEGKFSFPIIFAIQHQQSEDDRLIKILKQRTKNIELKKYAIQYMKECGAFEYTKNKLNELMEDIQIELNQLGGNPMLHAILQALHANIH